MFYYELKTTEISVKKNQNKYYINKIIPLYFNSLLKYKKKIIKF